MSTLKLKASECRTPMKYFRNEGDSRNSSEAKRVTLGITHNGKAYGMLYVSRQVGFKVEMFDPIVEMGTQQEHDVFDITPDDTLCTLPWKEVDKAYASFGNRVVTATLTEKGITLEDDGGSKITVKSADTRQLELPLGEVQCLRLASKLASGIDVDQFGGSAVQVSATALCNALLPAMKVTNLPGNTSDRKGVHVHLNSGTLRVVGAHKDAVFVYESKDAVKDCGGEYNIDCIISSDAAKRLRELLVSVIAQNCDEEGKCASSVYMKQCGEEVLMVCFGNWMITIDLLDICTTDCDAYLDMPGKNVFECNRVALFQGNNGLLAMGESELYWHLSQGSIRLEGEEQQHQGQRVMAIACKAFGAGEQLPVRKYPIRPVITMLSAASAAANNTAVKVLADADDEVLGIVCGEYNLFVK